MIYKGKFIQIPKGKISNNNLSLLANNLIKNDCVNFNINNVGLGFTSTIAEQLLKYIPDDKSISILIINGITLELYNTLKDKGYENVTLAFGNWNKEKDNYINNDKPTFEIMKEYIESNFEDDIKIIRLEEIFNMDKKFDLVISNPPYAIGNGITKAIIDNVDFEEFVNLMPVSKYKSGNLYKYVSEISSIKDTFDDAMIGDSLTIAVLKKKNTDIYHSYEEFENEKRDPRYQEFYKLNATRTHYAITPSHLAENRNIPEEELAALSNNKDFCVTMRTVQNGTHNIGGKGSFDIDWNINKNVSRDDLHIWVNKKTGKAMYTVDFIHFHSAIEHSHMCCFWYYNPLMNALLKGLGKSSGSPKPAIPNIDWSVERDYEHLTLEDIMDILRQEN